MQLEVYEHALYRDGELQTHEAPAATPAAPPPADLSKLDYTLIAWLALFILGGGFLALYYAGIGYFPEFSWQDSLTYLALMTITGGSLVVAYGLLLLLPGAIWSEFLIFDERLCNALTISDRSEPCVLNISRKLLLPFALFMVACHFLLALSAGRPPGPLLLAGMGAALTAASAVLWRSLRKRLARCRDRSSLLCRYVLTFDLAAVFSLAALLFFHWLYEGSAPESLLYLCTFMVVVTNLAVAMLFRQDRSKALMASLLAAVVLLGAGQFLGAEPASSEGLPAKIMKKFGFGERPVTLVLTEEGGRILDQYDGFHVQFTEPAGPAAGKPASKPGGELASGEAAQAGPAGAEREARLARVAGVTILSRLGTEYVLRGGGKTVSVPKKEILSWSF